MAEFRINISKLSEGIHEYSLESEPSRIGLDEHFDDKIKVEAKLDKSLRQIFLRAKIQANGKFVCDRCLEDIDRKLDISYSVVYIQSSRSTVDVKKEEEIQVLDSDTNYIDLDDDVRQYILLALPQKVLCKEECLGICPSCGSNRNNSHCSCQIEIIDTRWEALKKISCI